MWRAESWFSCTSAGKLTFRTQNDTDKANFRYTVDKKVHFASEKFDAREKRRQ